MNTGKDTISGIRKNTYFWLIFVVLTSAIYLSQVDGFLLYKSKIDILLLPKSEKVANNIELIKNNLEYLFDVEHDKKGDRNEIDVISRKDNTIITFQISSSDQKELRKKNKEVVTDFFNLASKHYNVRNDIEMRIVGDVEVESQPTRLWLLLLISVVGGFLITSVIFVIFEFVGKFLEKIVSRIHERRARIIEISDVSENDEIEKNQESFEKDVEEMKKEEIKKDVSDEIVGAEKDIKKEKKSKSKKERKEKKDESKDELKSKKIQEASRKLREKKEKKGIAEIEKIYKSYDQEGGFNLTSKSAPPRNLPVDNSTEKEGKDSFGSVPSNLPIGDNIVIIGDDGSEESTADSKNGNSTIEPTNEEYKKRLNQLLKGEM